MTNNINGIDVSECPLYDKKTGCYHTFDGKCVKDSCAVYKWLLEHKRLQEENEELKARLKTLDDEVLTIEITPDEFERYKKYEQTLEEIRNIAEKLITETPEYNSCYYKDECGDNCTPKKQNKVEYCCYENVDKILTIIDEVLNDRD